MADVRLQGDAELVGLQELSGQLFLARLRFLTLLDLTKADLDGKMASLEAWHQSVQNTGELGLLFYLRCQLSMLVLHAKRLEHYGGKFCRDWTASARVASAPAAGTVEANCWEVLLADLELAKRRCKHVLDVTDRYCNLGQSPGAGEGVPSGIGFGARVRRERGGSWAIPALQSLGNHAAVIAKTYKKPAKMSPRLPN
jgi:hypothetical protein